MNIFDAFISGSLNVKTNSIFTGIINVTGSLIVSGSAVVLSSQTSSMSASYAVQTTSASYATLASSSAYSPQATSASYAISASYAVNAGGGGGAGFPFSGSAIVTGSMLVTNPYIALSSSLAQITFDPHVSQSLTQSTQVFGVLITPSFWNVTSSQTQTGLRVLATFSGSNSGSNTTNRIVDFGSQAAGSQFTVTDQTSGSIYMVNDVSGLPIIEALSDWTINLWNYPNIILQKTGSRINVSGSLVMAPASSSFVLPLSQSNLPVIPTGSIFWSGSFLYVYNGTAYRSASFN